MSRWIDDPVFEQGCRLLSDWKKKFIVPGRQRLDPSTLPPYKYRSLGRNEFRVIVLLKGKKEDIVQVEVEHWDIVREHAYAALSYVWGDNKNNLHPVIINRKSVHWATYNLWQALRRVRAVYEDRVLWVDAICINQNDKNEKTQQLQHMPRIYPQASRVLCWLGGDDGTVAEAFAILGQWSDAYTDETLKYELASNTKRNLIQQRADQCHVLGAFFHRPYFRRAWCLQEVCVDTLKPPCVLCGDHELNWGVLCLAFVTISTTLGIDDMLSMIGSNVYHVLPMLTICWNPSYLFRLSYLIPMVLDREAELPHDKMFSLLGLAERHGLKYPPPEYDRSFEDTCVLYTRAMIVIDQNLDILGAICTFGYGDRMPSWSIKADRWRKDESMMETRDSRRADADESRYRFNATCRMKAHIESPSGPLDPILKTFGYEFDRVIMLQDVHPFWELELSREGINWSDMMDAFSKYCADLQLPAKYTATGESMLRAFLRTLTCDDFWQHSQTPLYESWQQSPYAAYQVHIRDEGSDHDIRHGGPGAVLGKDKLISYMAHHFGLEKQSSRDVVGSQEVGHYVVSDSLHAFLDRQAILELRKQIELRLGFRKLLVTEKGYIGVAPKGCKEGDGIYLLLGSTVPLILRPAQRDGGGLVHSLIGDAYVHGIMYGEGLDGHLEGLSSATDPLAAGATLFNIV